MQLPLGAGYRRSNFHKFSAFELYNTKYYPEYTKARHFGKTKIKLDAGMWRYHANRMDARRSQFDLGRVDAYI